MELGVINGMYISFVSPSILPMKLGQGSQIEAQVTSVSVNNELTVHSEAGGRDFKPLLCQNAKHLNCIPVRCSFVYSFVTEGARVHFKWRSTRLLDRFVSSAFVVLNKLCIYTRDSLV